jgi:hypothetical protein
LPNLSEVAQDPKTIWKPTTIANWYGSVERTVEISSETAVWYSTGLPAVPVRWVVVRDPEGKFKAQALLCTDLDADPEQILSWFVMRWQLEVTFQEVRRHLGFETQRQWSEMAIRRTTPALLGLFSLVTMFAHLSDERGSGYLSASGLVPQERSDLCRCARLGRQTVVGSGRDLLRVACGNRDGKSPTSICGTPNRCGLLCSLMVKVELSLRGVCKTTPTASVRLLRRRSRQIFLS